MKKIVSLAVVCAMGIGISNAQGEITISAVEMPNIWLDLQMNGWTGYMLTLTADAASQNKITTVEFANDLLGLGLPIGIRGTLHQSWIQPAVGSATRVPTPSSPKTAPANDGSEVDSYFLNSGYYDVAVASPFTETNNLVNVENNFQFNGSPLPDEPATASGKNTIPGADYGVGNVMTFTGAANVNSATSSVNLAFVIVPRGAYWGTGYYDRGAAQVVGAAVDPLGKAFPIVFSYPTPEPATVGALGMGAVGLLVRRRRPRQGVSNAVRVSWGAEPRGR